MKYIYVLYEEASADVDGHLVKNQSDWDALLEGKIVVKIFEKKHINELEDQINGFGKTCTIKNVSISSYMVGGYSTWYTAAVLYEK